MKNTDATNGSRTMKYEILTNDGTGWLTVGLYPTLTEALDTARAYCRSGEWMVKGPNGSGLITTWTV